jgi:hypothetical protein
MRERARAIGIACFVAHVALVAGYVWIASSGGTTPVPEPPRVFRGHYQPWHPVFDLQRWDAILYAEIAANGYASPSDPHRPSHLVNWFPGLPLLARGVRAVTGWSYSAALASLGLACTLAFWLVLWSRPARAIFGSEAVATTSALVLVWPGSFFWLAGMTEPPVALLSLVAIIWWAEERYGRTAMLLAFSTAVKQLFVVMTVVFAGLRWIHSRPRAPRAALELAVGTSGILAFCAYCAYAFGDPLAWLHAGMRLFSALAPRPLSDARGFLDYASTVNGCVALGTVALLAVTGALLLPALRRDGLRVVANRPLSPTGVDVLLWALATSETALFLAGNFVSASLWSMFRYQTANVPLFLLCGRGLARLSPRWRYPLLVALFAAASWLGAHFTAAYWRWEWVS